MSKAIVNPLIAEISHEISRDEHGWYFTQRAAARICGMDWKTIRDGLQVDASSWFPGAGLGGSKMLKSIAAQGISPAGLAEFKQQWVSGRISDVLVSCLITYAATQKKGERDAEVVRLHGVMAAAGLRSLLDAAFGVEDVKGRVTARLEGIEWRVQYTSKLAKEHKNIGAYTAAITAGVTSHVPKTWTEKIIPSQIEGKTGTLRDHADEGTLALIRGIEKEVVEGNFTGTPKQFGCYARDVAESARRHLGYEGVRLSPAKLTPRTARDVRAGKKSGLADAATGEMFKLPDA